MKRKPAVAGQFYTASAARLNEQVKQYVIDVEQKERAIGILSPHAGLMYSGSVAGAVYSSIKFPATFILLGPNHTGLGRNVSIMTSSQWEMPDTTFSVDEDLGKKIIRNTPLVSEDEQAHVFEHSLEVQLPFISYFSHQARIVPITIMSASLQECRAIGEGIAKSVREISSEKGYDVLIAASSDMSHYLPDDVARRLDQLAINEILNLNPEGLYNTVKKERISMCGYLPATIMLYASLELGAKESKLLKYSTSGDVSGDYGHVVGYAGIIIK